MAVDRPNDLDVIDTPREDPMQSISGSLLGLHISDWMFLLAGVGIAAAILLIA
jgi:hypothetical protein